ncbi:MAG: imidazoleglycerol-phosphate dehydratase HisB [Methanomicrobiales archaeon]|nr:imidazoleglycerol-phosphate dehydratase HisB [Methanomicrobiales archaeon]MDI6875664.1 imidazoleglycerol-phosphate dehydratase HisB [Methanomicrobiales archaeon]
MRKGTVQRKTGETDIEVILDLDGGKTSVRTGLPFMDHMLTSMSRHGGFSLTVKAKGDLEVDSHHLVEDLGIALGTAIKQAVGDGRGIRRFAHALIPMDEALAQVAIDCSGRGYLVFRGEFGMPQVGGIPPDLFEHFFYSCCIHAGVTAHIAFSGSNDHHTCEAIFKAFGIALGEATAVLPGRSEIPSTKGVL